MLVNISLWFNSPDEMQERLARLAGGVAVLQIGGSSEVEVGEKKVQI